MESCRPVLCFIACILFFCCPVSALLANLGKTTETPDVHVFGDIVVIASTQNTLLDTPANISVITADDLGPMGAKDVIDVLERIPSVNNTSASSPTFYSWYPQFHGRRFRYNG